MSNKVKREYNQSNREERNNQVGKEKKTLEEGWNQTGKVILAAGTSRYSIGHEAVYGE